MKSCSIEGCEFPAFRTDKNTYKRYCSNHWYQHSTDIDKRSAYQKHLDKQKNKSKKVSVKSSVRSLINTTPNKVVKEKSAIRSELLMLADKLFGNFIKKRDSDLDGNIICICCKNQFNLLDTLEDGSKIVQPLHFIDRDVFSLRFEPMQVNSGCCWCNKKQHDSPTGLTYHQYKEFLIGKYGKDVVANMEDEKRNVNKLTHADLNLIISKYKPVKNNG